MNTTHPNTENKSQFPLGNVLAKSWMGWAVFFFLTASLFGLAMRYFFLGEIPYFDYRHLLHAHSHIALLGWGYLLVSGALVFTFVTDQKRLTTYRSLLTWGVLANFGMLFSFPFHGYGVFSIAFSTLQLLVSYVFAYQFLKDLNKTHNSASIKLIRYSIYWLVLSSLGLWAIAPIGSLLGKMHPLYFISVQWFLHLQLNGWFVFAFLGLVVHYAVEKKAIVGMSNWVLVLLNLSLLFTFALAVSWSIINASLYYFNTIGVILQAIAYFLILHFAGILKSIFIKIPKDWIEGMIYLGILSLLAKALIQLTLVIPEVATISYTIRMYVIGFIHLVMLGSITFGIGGLAVRNGWFASNSPSKWAWIILSIGFITSEILLLTQGTLLWAKLGFIPHYHLMLFISSALFPLALILMLINAVKKRQDTSKSNLKTQSNLTSVIPLNKKTMKISMLISYGAALLLMTSCGGGGENQSSSTPPSSQTEKVADPKGIGEIKHVDLGDGIDEAMANRGKAILDMKCTACHQYNDKRLVGPGFENVTNRRRPEWIMNMITNVEVMLDEDPVAQKLFEECLTRMPNQNISIGDSRDILEFLRKNDFERTGKKDAAIN